MPEHIPNGFFCRDLIVFNHLRRGGFVSKGFIFEAPDLTNSPVADLNDFQDQLCLLLASLHEHQRLQVQYFCDSDYKGGIAALPAGVGTPHPIVLRAQHFESRRRLVAAHLSADDDCASRC